MTSSHMKGGFLIPMPTAKPAHQATMDVRSMITICRDKGETYQDHLAHKAFSQLTSLSRSSSFSARFRFAGGPNSIDHFARSWQRAACFPEVLPRRSSFAAVRPDEEWTSGWNEDLASRSSLSARQETDYTRPLLHGDEEEDGGNTGHSKRRSQVPPSLAHHWIEVWGHLTVRSHLGSVRRLGDTHYNSIGNNWHIATQL